MIIRCSLNLRLFNMYFFSFLLWLLVSFSDRDTCYYVVYLSKKRNSCRREFDPSVKFLFSTKREPEGDSFKFRGSDLYNNFSFLRNPMRFPFVFVWVLCSWSDEYTKRDRVEQEGKNKMGNWVRRRMSFCCIRNSFFLCCSCRPECLSKAMEEEEETHTITYGEEILCLLFCNFPVRLFCLFFRVISGEWLLIPGRISRQWQWEKEEKRGIQWVIQMTFESCCIPCFLPFLVLYFSASSSSQSNLSWCCSCNVVSLAFSYWSFLSLLSNLFACRASSSLLFGSESKFEQQTRPLDSCIFINWALIALP